VNATGPESPLGVVILAAGAGTRMRSTRPKPLHEVAGATLIAHAMNGADAAGPERVVVVTGHGAEAVAQAARAVRPDVALAHQSPQRGTGDAVRCALPALEGFAGVIVVLYADTPFVRPETIRRAAAAVEAGAAAAVLGFEPAEPGGYGRLITDDEGALLRIVEAADADDAERAARLCNSGVMAFRAEDARRWLPALSADNAKGEFYLTEIVAMARAEGHACAVARCAEEETLGVNTRADLARAEAVMQARLRARAMAEGATLVAPETVFLSMDARIGRDVVLGPQVVVGPGVTIEDDVVVEAFCHLEGCTLRSGARVGPFARLRPGAEIGPGARVGNFVEVKNATLAEGAKVNHLSYVGDAGVGPGANLGAGTITCNYDGFAKHRTEIGAGAFIGSNTALVAPVRVGDSAYVGSGSVVTDDVPEDALALGRGRQVNKPGMAARLRARLASLRRDRSG